MISPLAGGGVVVRRADRAAVGILCGFLSVWVAACAEREAPTDEAPARVRAVVLPFLTASPFYIAAEEGFFEEQNIDVEFVKLARTVEAIPALVHGDVDVGYGQLTVTVLNAIASGARMKLVAGTGYLAPDGCTVNGVVARRALVESGRLTRPEELLGLRVELDVLLPTAYYVDRLLRPTGLSIDDLDIVRLPARANVDALIGGSIDVTVASEPHLTRAMSSGEAVVWRGSQDIVPDFQLSSVIFGPNLLDDRPEVGEGFMIAFRKAMRQYELGKTPRNLEIIARGTRIPVQELRELCWPVFREDGRVGTTGMVDYQEWLVGRGLLERVTPPEDLVEERFVDRANAILEQ